MQSLHRVEKAPPFDGTGGITREISRLRVSWERFPSAPYRHAAPLEMTMLASAPPVISTEAGQPPIGKPLIVQARGQLRLTWRLYAESPQSGEISPSDGTGSITREISRLRVSSKRFPSAPYRHAAPLEMTMGRFLTVMEPK